MIDPREPWFPGTTIIGTAWTPPAPDNTAIVIVKLKARYQEIKRELASVDALRAEQDRIVKMLEAVGEKP